MLQNSISVKNRHRKFIKEIVEHEFVWALKSEEGYATSSSNEDEDENGEPIVIICFWSDKKLASVCSKKYWQEYKPSKIELNKFLENWCVGMYHDDTIVGTNFDWNLFGQENDPLELIVEIVDELKKVKKELTFNKFDDIKSLKNQALKILEEENEIRRNNS